MINLGDEVKDRVTGFIGIAVSRTNYLNGCDRIDVYEPAQDYILFINNEQIERASKSRKAYSSVRG